MPVGVHGPRPGRPARPADRADLLAVGSEDLHLVGRFAHADVDPSFPVQGQRPGVLQVRDQRLGLATFRIQGEHAGALGDHEQLAVGSCLRVGRRFHRELLQQLAGLAVKYDDQIGLREAQVQPAAMCRHQIGFLGHVLGIGPERLDVQVGQVVRSAPRAIGTRRGVEPVDVAAQMLGIDHAPIHGHQLGARHARRGCSSTGRGPAGRRRAGPCPPPPRSSRDRPACPSAAHADRHAVVAAPVALRRRRSPRGAAAVAGPAAQAEADALVPERAPGVRARRHRLAGCVPVPGRSDRPTSPRACLW